MSKQSRQIISDPVDVSVRNPDGDIVYVRSGHALAEFPEFAVHRNLLDMWTVSHIETGAGPVSVPNAVRSKAVIAALELLRAKSQKDITRAVNKAKRKIRAAEKRYPIKSDGGGSRSQQVATANESGETMARQGIGTVREIPPASTRGVRQ